MNHGTLAMSLAAALALASIAASTASAEGTRGTHGPRKDSDSVAAREGAPQSGNEGSNMQAPGVGSDGETPGMLQATNAHEIAAAELAKQENVSAPVMQYAERLDKEHRANEGNRRLVSNEAGVNVFERKDVEALQGEEWA